MCIKMLYALWHMACAEKWMNLIAMVRLLQVQCGARYPQKQRCQRVRSRAPIVRLARCNSSAWATQMGADTTVVRVLSQDLWTSRDSSTGADRF